jgi:hypothetical protein
MRLREVRRRRGTGERGRSQPPSRSAKDLASESRRAETVGPEFFLVSPDIPLWRRWLTRWSKDRMLIFLTAVIAVETLALVVLAFVR